MIVSVRAESVTVKAVQYITWSTVVPPRNLPAALRDRVKNTLDEMEKMNVIQRVDEPTEWVNSLVVIEKPNS